MATVLLAIGDAALREACRAQLDAAGHAPLLLDRPLAALSLAPKVGWDAACLDASSLGRASLAVLTAADAASPVIGLGLETAALRASIPLPLVAQRLLTTLDQVVAGASAPARVVSLRLDTARRLAANAGREVALTRTEFRLLEVLFEHHPADVSLVEVLTQVWGSSEGRGAAELVRAHVRNLRVKLAEIGLVDAVRSHRGRGYALVLP